MSETERNRRLDYRKVRKKWISLQAGILAVIILMAVVSTVVFFQLDKTHYINYTEHSTVDYGVHLKENEFYEEDYLGKDQAYVASLIKQVEAAFEYELHMDSKQKVDFKYTYGIDAILQITDKNSGGVLFTPTYTVLPARTIERSGNGLIINEIVSLNYDTYNELASKFIESYDLKSTESNIILQMKVNVIGASEEFNNSTAQNEYITSLNIPLTTKTVNVNLSSSIPQEENKILACNDSVARVVFQVLAIVFASISALLGLEIFAFVYLTRNTDITYEIKVGRLLKTYKSFIQKITNPFNTAGYQLLMVDTFNEMLEIRDTIQSPILMNENADKTRTRFYIPTNTKLLYVFELKVDDYDEIYSTPDPEPDELDEDVEDDFDDEDEIYEKRPAPVVAPASAAVPSAPVAPASVAVAKEPSVPAMAEVDEEELLFPAPAAGNGYSNVRRSFMAKLIQSTDDRKKYYSEIKNELLSYSSVKARCSWNLETFNKGRTNLAKIAMKGKTVCLYLALEPSDFIDTKYFYTDLSDKTQFRTVPMMVKIKSNRAVKHAKELIEALAARHELTKSEEFVPVDYVMPYQSTEDLIREGLIKDPDREIVNKDGVSYETILDRLFDGMIENATAKLNGGSEAPVPAAPVLKVVEASDMDDVQLLEPVAVEAVMEALKQPNVSLEDIDYVDSKEPEFEGGTEVVDVVWKERDTANKLHRYDPNGASLNDGDVVLVPVKDTVKNKDTIRKAAVAHGNHKVDPDSIDTPLKKIIGVLKRKMQDAINSSLNW